MECDHPSFCMLLSSAAGPPTQASYTHSDLFLSLLPLLLQVLFIVWCLDFWHSSCVIQLPQVLFFFCPFTICLELKSHMSFSFWDSSLPKGWLSSTSACCTRPHSAPTLLHSHHPPTFHFSSYVSNMELCVAFRNVALLHTLNLWSWFPLYL